MSLVEYRASPLEMLRTEDLLRLAPSEGSRCLDVGARDGHFARLFAERFSRVVALDLSKPQIDHPRIDCIEASAARMPFESRAFDFVFCAEVLEHIDPSILPVVCGELMRVSSGAVLVGVPYRQDLRIGRTTCRACGGKNPPWGHVNRFDEASIASLFPGFRVLQFSYVGSVRNATNAISAALMDAAGNPYGTYDQDEPCIHCGAALGDPPRRTVVQRALTKLAFWARRASELRAEPRANWMHALLVRA